MNIILITGGSKGIGKALAIKYATEDYQVYSLARTSSQLENIHAIFIDLFNLSEIETKFTSLLKEIVSSEVTSITLINNAGRIGKISNLENLELEDISKTIQLNTTTPLVLSRLFIKFTKKLTCKKQIINISSGAAKNVYSGWTTYCASKAAIDMITQTITAEQSELKNGVKCISIYPGVVNTNMQTQIRNTDLADFKNLQKFVDLKENNKLFSSKYVAETIFKIDIENHLKSGDIIDIRNF